MAALPLQTFNTPDTPIFFPLWVSTVTIQNVRGDIATFSSINVKGIVSTTTAYISTAITDTLSTIYLEAAQGYISSLTSEHILAPNISANTVVIGSNTLTTNNPGPLLLNGVPVATTADVSNWSLNPAVSDVNMANYNVNNGATANFTGLSGVVMGSIKILNSSNIINSNSITTQSLETTAGATIGTTLGVTGQTTLGKLAAASAAIGSISTNFISTGSLLAGSFVTSTLAATSVSTLQLSTGSLYAGSATAQTATINSNLFLPRSSDPFYGAAIVQGNHSPGFAITNYIDAASTEVYGDVSFHNGFYNFYNNAIEANANIDLHGGTMCNTRRIDSQGAADIDIACGRNLNLTGDNGLTTNSITTIITNNAGNNVSLNSLIRLNAKNGNRGRIELTADPGYAYIQGEVALTGNAGVNSVLGIGFGGRITLNAGSAGIPSGFNTFYPSYVLQTGDSILSYAGGLTPITGVYGYNYIQGFNGVNIVAGTVSVIPNVPGTVYLYGTNAAGSGNSGGVRIQNGLSVDTIFPFPTGFVSPPYDLTLRGNAAGNMVSLSNVRDIYGGNTTNQGNIYSMSNINCYNLNTTNINGLPYGATSPNLVVSSITAVSSLISSLTVSSINGLPYTGGGGWVGTATSDLNMNGYNISSVQALNINSGSQVRMGTPLAYVRAGYTSGTATSTVSLYAASGIVGVADNNISFTDTKQLTLAGSNVDIAANNTIEIYTANQGLSIYSVNGGVSTFAPNVSIVGSNSVGVSGSNINLLASSNINIAAPVVALSNVSSINGVPYTGGWVGTATSDLNMAGYNIKTLGGSNLNVGTVNQTLSFNQGSLVTSLTNTTGGIQVTAALGSFSVNASNINLTGSLNTFIGTTNTLTLSGANVAVTGTNVTLSNVTAINGVAYNPVVSTYTDLYTTTLSNNPISPYLGITATSGIALSNLSSINGSPYTGGGSWVGTATSDLNMAGYNIKTLGGSNLNVGTVNQTLSFNQGSLVTSLTNTTGGIQVTAALGSFSVNASNINLTGSLNTFVGATNTLTLSGTNVAVTGTAVTLSNVTTINGVPYTSASPVVSTFTNLYTSVLSNNPVSPTLAITAANDITVSTIAGNINLYAGTGSGGGIKLNSYMVMLGSGNPIYMGGNTIDCQNGDITNLRTLYPKYGGSLNSSQTSGVNYLDLNAPPTTGSGTGQLRIFGNKGSLIFDDNVALAGTGSNYVGMYNQYGFVQIAADQNVHIGGGGSNIGGVNVITMYSFTTIRHTGVVGTGALGLEVRNNGTRNVTPGDLQGSIYVHAAVPNATGESGSQITLDVEGNYGGAVFGGVKQGSWGFLSLFTNNGSGTQTERMRIRADTGYVGIGTNTPVHTLDVNGNVRFTEYLTMTGAGTSPIYMNSNTIYTQGGIIDLGGTSSNNAYISGLNHIYGNPLTAGGYFGGMVIDYMGALIWNGGGNNASIVVQNSSKVLFIDNQAADILIDSHGYGLNVYGAGVNFNTSLSMNGYPINMGGGVINFQGTASNNAKIVGINSITGNPGSADLGMTIYQVRSLVYTGGVAGLDLDTGSGNLVITNTGGDLNLNTTSSKHVVVNTGSFIMLGGYVDMRQHDMIGVFNITNASSNINITANNDINVTSQNGAITLYTPNGVKVASERFERALGSSSIVQPVFQQGATTGSGNSGSTSVTIPQGYTTVGSYQVFVTHTDANPPNISVVRNTSNAFTIYWTNGSGGGTQPFDWMTAGT